MAWTINFHDYKTKLWTEHAQASVAAGKHGHACYAWEQVGMWQNFANDARKGFDTSPTFN